jgi:hypothetical protein
MLSNYKTLHFIWIGNRDIPNEYLNNYRHSIHLNYDYVHKLWDNKTTELLLNEYNLMQYFAELSFICKCNLLKYLILHKEGGAYSDLDIKWNRPIRKLLNDFPPGIDILASIQTTGGMTIGDSLVSIVDDPFLVVKPNLMGQCISFCQNRTILMDDGDLYATKGVRQTHKLEPVGPFGLTEWITATKQNIAVFPQKDLLDHTGWYGVHAQKMNWKQ